MGESLKTQIVEEPGTKAGAMAAANAGDSSETLAEALDPILWHRLEKLARACAPSIAGRYGILGDEVEDIPQDALAGLYLCFRNCLARGASLPDNLDAFVRASVVNTCKRRLAAENPDRSRIHDAVLDTLNGRRNMQGLAVWQCGRQRVGGWEGWTGKTPRETPQLLQLRSDDTEFRSFLGRRRAREDIPSLVAEIFNWVETPLAVTEIVGLIARFKGVAPLRMESLDGSPESESPEGDSPGRGLGETLACDAPGPERLLLLQEQVAAVALYAASLDRKNLGSWLLGISSDEVEALFRACQAPQHWVRHFEDWLGSALNPTCLEALKECEDLPAALLQQYARQLEMTERKLRACLKMNPWEDARIGKFLGLTAKRVAYLRWSVRGKLKAMMQQVFGESGIG